MAPTLVSVTCDNHISHHFINPHSMFEFILFKQFSKVLNKNGILKLFSFVPVSVPGVLSVGTSSSETNGER
jgi:hypothetical protein